jgi:hypothetical protein
MIKDSRERTARAWGADSRPVGNPLFICDDEGTTIALVQPHEWGVELVDRGGLRVLSLREATALQQALTACVERLKRRGHG